jgi:ABC-2 type transport system permease protein
MSITLSDHPGRRIGAMTLRYWYLLRGSWPRLLELLYWPMVQVLLWGFISRFLQGNSSWVAQGAGVLLAAVLLWDVMFRSQFGMALAFLEELWSRNLGHLFTTPMRAWEWVVSMMLTSFIRLIIGVTPAVIAAYLFYNYSLISMGPPLIAFIAGLVIMGWWLSLIIIAAILRYGLGAESLAWMAVGILAPFSAVYYPVSSLPHWVQHISYALPSSYIFEGMRGVLFRHEFSYSLFGKAMALNAIYFAIGGVIFALSFRNARQRGALLQVGE